MPSKDKITDPIRTQQQAMQRCELREDEALEDYLSLYDAMSRYGISRSTLRKAVIAGDIPALLAGGIARKVSYVRRSDLIEYISRPAHRMATHNPARWRRPGIA